jgi:uncharacterized membrane protein
MDDDERRRHVYERTHDPSRVLALSDGVFAIVMTLLVLEIHVPELRGGQTLRVALQEVRPSFVAFLISFVVVAISWAGHRDLFAHVRRTDRSLVWLNILYLLPLSILPFGAALISRYQSDPVALTMYGTLLVLMALTRLAMWLYATGRRPHLLYQGMDAQARRYGIAIIASPAVLNLIAVLIAHEMPQASLVIYGTVPVLYFLSILVSRSSVPPELAE